MTRFSDFFFMVLVVVVLVGSVIEERNARKLRARLASAA